MVKYKILVPRIPNFTKIDKILLESHKETVKIAQLMADISDDPEQIQGCKKIIENLENK